jgi:manganese efflux pump family protein
MIELLFVALAVGLDNFGAAIGLGISGVDRSLRIRVAIIFGLFEAAMPVLGILVGRATAGDLGSSAPVVGGVLLGAMGAYSIASSILERSRDRPAPKAGIWRMILLGAALSLDNLVIGFALGSHHLNIAVAVITIGLTSTVLSLLGLELGNRLGLRFGERSEVLGGAILIVVGIVLGTGLF